MPEVVLIPTSLAAFGQPIQIALSGRSVPALALAVATLVLLLAVEVLIAVARLLEPVFAFLRTLLRLLFVLGVALAIILMLGSGSAHGAGPTDVGSAQRPAGTMP
jgi:hypothetical protein